MPFLRAWALWENKSISLKLVTARYIKPAGKINKICESPSDQGISPMFKKSLADIRAADVQLSAKQTGASIPWSELAVVNSCISPQRGPYTILCMMKKTDMIVKESIGRENLYVVAFSQSVFPIEVNNTLNCALGGVWVLLPAKAAGNNLIIMSESIKICQV